MRFEQLQLNQELLRALGDIGYQEPTPIQEQAIPPVLEGRDVLGLAQTGTGKTAAFALPILQRLETPREKQTASRHIRTLVLTPTRELALQIQESFVSYAKYTGLRSAVIFGGVSQNPQVQKLQKGVDILIATPGRLWDLIGQNYISLKEIECFVLDEADRMLDMGFFPDVKRIVKLLPEKRQTLLFSATMPREIQQLADHLLTDPIHVAVTPAATTVEKIRQQVYMVDRCNKRALLAHVIRENGQQQTLVFTRTKYGADRVARDLNRIGISAAAIHGDKSQGARQRALSDFKTDKICALVATDIAARGIDISGLPFVINFDLPEVPETYVHRIGRTGRAGMEGTAISFCDEGQTSYLIDIEELTGKRLEEVEEHPHPMTGEKAAPPEPKPRQAQNQRPKQDGAKRQGKPQTKNTTSDARKEPRNTAQGAEKPKHDPKRENAPKKTEQAVREPATAQDAAAQKATRKPRRKSGERQVAAAHPQAEARHAAENTQQVRTERKDIKVQPEKVQPRTAEPGRRKQSAAAKSRGGNRGGRRVMDDDTAQVETRPLPKRELNDSIRAKIASKVADILNKRNTNR